MSDDDLMQQMFEERIPLITDVLYKILDKNDANYQGLYKKASSVEVFRKGIKVSFKENFEKGDVLLIEFNIDNDRIKACCAINDCMKIEGFNSFSAELEFIIIKSDAVKIIDAYVTENTEAVV
jgi:hypothetical protein